MYVTIRKMKLTELRLDGDTQARVAIDQTVADEYAESMKACAKFPPVIVYYDGKCYWLADGFHRYYGYVKAGINEIDVEIKEGSQRDAKLFAMGANAVHGLRRTNADKRKAVTTLLNDDEWKKWSDGTIAERCGVSDRFVSQLRKELSPNGSEMKRTAKRNGKAYSIETANIGKAKPIEVVDSADVDKETDTANEAGDRDTVAASTTAAGDKSAGTDNQSGESGNHVAKHREDIGNKNSAPRPKKAEAASLPADWLEHVRSQSWAPLTEEPTKAEEYHAILVFLPKFIPANNELKAFVERSQNLRCSAIVTQGLHALWQEPTKAKIHRKKTKQAGSGLSNPEFVGIEV